MISIRKELLLLVFTVIALASTSAQTFNITGELKEWHKVTIEFDGPTSSETATPNPFSDYRLEVTFTNGTKAYTVPGYFAADGNTAETSASAGDQWFVHFAPDTIGTWNFTSTFYTGADVAISDDTSNTGILHNISGSFVINSSDKTGTDFRGRGRLSYVGEHYLRFLGDSTWFYKAGADAPENTLAYFDFDDVPNRGGRKKTWELHQQDYIAADGAQYTWKNGKGTELLGVIDYLSAIGVNAFSFLTFSLAGDDENVFPHLLKVDTTTYNGYNDAQQWDLGVEHDRFDVSRMAQWERIFQYADQKGLYCHFKTQETENDGKMDGGDVGRERKLYYRELIARFSHHLALNWNTGEENTQSEAQEIAMAEYLQATDPYKHNTVMHTYPGQYNRYDALIGNQSEYTGASIQTSNRTYNELFGVVEDWVTNSQNAAKKWVIAVDEPGNASIGIHSDPNDLFLVRHKVLWGTMMAGGAGVEYYYGYQSGCGDLNCEDHRSREDKYIEASYAINFFENHLQDYLPVIVTNNAVTADNSDYAMTNATNCVVVYRPTGGTTEITLNPALTWTLNWYNPRNGVMGTQDSIITDSLIAPDDINDWVALITAACPPIGTPCDDGISATTNDTIDMNCQCIGSYMSCPPQGAACDDGNPNTVDDEEDGLCNCVGTELLFVPGIVQAENFTVNFGTIPEPCGDVGGGENLGFINDGDSTAYEVNILTAGTYQLRFRAASNSIGGSITYALDGESGSVAVSNTSDWQVYEDFVVEETFTTTGIKTLVLKYQGTANYLLNLNYVEFIPINCTAGQACNDNNSQTQNDIYDANCICAGTIITSASPLLNAENALVGSMWTITSDPMACQSSYALPPNSTSTANAPENVADIVKFTFNLDSAGTYKVFARTLTIDGDSDSFWVRANGGTWQRWNKINFGNYGNTYQWSQVGNWTSGDAAVPVTFALTTGENTVDFAWREPGARLDKIYVTQGDLAALNVVASNVDSGNLSFRYMVEESCPLDTIKFDISTNGTPILLDTQAVIISKPIVILGNGALETWLDGDNTHQIFISNSASLELSKLKMYNGYATTDGGAFINTGTLKLSDVLIENNFEGTIPKAFTSTGEIIIEMAGSVELKE